LSLIFSTTKKQKNCKNYQRMYRKYLFTIISLQINITLVTQSLLATEVRRRELEAKYFEVKVSFSVRL
jgi:hypothetical protein